MNFLKSLVNNKNNDKNNNQDNDQDNKKEYNKIKMEIYKNFSDDTYKLFISNNYRQNLTIMDPKQLEILFKTDINVASMIKNKVKDIFENFENTPFELLGICNGRFVGISCNILHSLNGINKQLQIKYGNNCKITDITFTKNLEDKHFVLVSASASQEKLKKITKLDLIPSSIYSDKYGEIDNYISGYNIKLDTENFAEKYNFKHLVNKEIPVLNVNETIPTVTITDEDMIYVNKE